LYLSYLTGNPIYAEKAIKVYDILLKNRPSDGLYPENVITFNGNVEGDVVSISAGTDSFYEYLFKLWLLTGRKNNLLKEWAYKQLDEIKSQLLIPFGNDMYLSGRKSRFSNHLSSTMHHLDCFSGGLFALASQYTDDAHKKDEYLKVAKGLAKFCRAMYDRNPTGLATEGVYTDGDKINAENSFGKNYRQRPEAVESWFVLYRITKDPIYREWGHKFLQAIESKTRVHYGYACLYDATVNPPNLENFQQSFFLAETLKYLYLLFSPDDILPLDQYVFNTEAHPFPIFDYPLNFTSTKNW